MTPLSADPRRRKALVALGWAIVLAVVLVSFRIFDWQSVASRLRQASIPWVVAAIALNLSILLPWAQLWRLLLPDRRMVSYLRMMEVNALVAAATNTAPLFTGHAAGIAALAIHGRVGPGVALSVTALDQVAEGISKLLVLAAAAAIVALPLWLTGGIHTLAAGVVLLTVVLLVMAHRPGVATALPLPDSIRAAIARWSGHLLILRTPSAWAAVLLLAVAMKVLEAAAILAVQRALGVQLPAGSAIVILAAVNMATLVSVTPGNLGAYEAGTFLAYRFLGLPPDQALGLAVVQHLCYLVAMIGAGSLVMLTRSGRAAREAFVATPPRENVGTDPPA